MSIHSPNLYIYLQVTFLAKLPSDSVMSFNSIWRGSAAVRLFMCTIGECEGCCEPKLRVVECAPEQATDDNLSKENQTICKDESTETEEKTVTTSIREKNDASST